MGAAFNLLRKLKSAAHTALQSLKWAAPIFFALLAAFNIAQGAILKLVINIAQGAILILRRNIDLG